MNPEHTHREHCDATGEPRLSRPKARFPREVFFDPRLLTDDAVDVELDVWSRRLEIWEDQLTRDFLPGGHPSDGRDLLRAGIEVAKRRVRLLLVERAERQRLREYVAEMR